MPDELRNLAATARPPGLDLGPRRNPLLQPAAYPTLYTWYVFFSSLDVLFTWLILRAGGREMNGLAHWIIESFNLPGMVTFKFLMVVLVVGICEILSRRRYTTGLRVARWAIILSAFPVVFGAGQLFAVVVLGGG
jgi:hypothetical protein